MIPCENSRPASSEPALVSGEESPTNRPTRKTKTRSACDRCHAQKLKCRKSSSRDSCDRCLRQELGCVFSPRITRNSRTRRNVGSEAPRLRSLVPSTPRELDKGSDSIATTKSRPGLIADDRIEVDALPITLPTYYQENASNLNLQTPILYGHGNRDVQNGLPDIEPQANTVFNPQSNRTKAASRGNDRLSPHTLQHTRTLHLISNGDPYAELPPPSMMGKLTELNISIYKCAKELPSVKSVPSNSIPRSGSNQPRTSRLFVLDDLFHLSEELIDAMNSLTLNPVAGTTASTETRQTLFDTTLLASPGMGASELLQFNQSMSRLDFTTSFILLSCHYQLAGIYTTLFHLIQVCSQNTLRLPTLSSESGVLLPRIQMGSSVSCPPVRVDVYTPLPPAAFTTYINLVTMILSRLWTRLAESMTTGFLEMMKEELALDSQSCALSATWDTAFKTTSNLSNTIHVTKQMLQLC
ncbi:hypothetical protein F5Y18DRAFT_26011 [Xylariaceae sp. FL1019]|nr:hypothetical protein F5Y18DRAFT_26011 [Xylariaceae sp. FL1019]